MNKVIWTRSLLTYKQQWRLISQQLPNSLLMLWGVWSYFRVLSKYLIWECRHCMYVMAMYFCGEWQTDWLIAGGKAVIRSSPLCYWLIPAYFNCHLKLWAAWMLTTFTQLQGISPSKCYTTELQSLLQKIQVSGKKINKLLKADIMRTRKGKGIKFVREKKKKEKKKWACPGVEPGTSRTRSENHTPRPTSLWFEIIENL